MASINDPDPADPDRLPKAASRDEPRAIDALVPLVYDELKRIASHLLRVSSARTTLCTTELVHEAYLRLTRRGQSDEGGIAWQGRAHFFGTAARAMRQVLVDLARRRYAAKRGGRWGRVTLTDAHEALEIELDEILALDSALDRLDAVDSRLRAVVELRFFAGLSEEEIGDLLGVSTRTIERDWLKARLFLLRELDGMPDDRPDDSARHPP